VKFINLKPIIYNNEERRVLGWVHCWIICRSYYQYSSIYSIPKGYVMRFGEMKKGGIKGDLHSLTDELLAQKIQIFIDKIKPIKYYYIDEYSNSLIIGLDENYTQDAADKLYKEATSQMEFFDADSVDMHYIHKKQTEYSIKLKKVAKFAEGY
jgi:hypothetical protein